MDLRLAVRICIPCPSWLQVFAHQLLGLDYRLSLFDYIDLPIQLLNWRVDLAVSLGSLGDLRPQFGSGNRCLHDYLFDPSHTVSLRGHRGRRDFRQRQMALLA